MNLIIDAGGTNLRAQIHSNGLKVKSFRAKSKDFGLAYWIENILKDNPKISTIGIAYAGPINNGCIIEGPNIKVDVYNIREYFKSKYNLPLFIENDLTCAALAEAQEYKSKNLCALYVGTGLGLGVIESGRIVRGSENIAAEIGHVPFRNAPFKCGCGRQNCMELFVSGSGVKKWIKYLNITSDGTLDSLKNEKNPQAREVLNNFEEALLYAAGTTITLFNPEILVLGGGIIDANHYLSELVKSNISLYALKGSLKNIKIIQSNLSDAPLLGALLLKDLHV